MARRTHPAPKSKHARQHTRQQRQRIIDRRWRRARNTKLADDRTTVYPVVLRDMDTLMDLAGWLDEQGHPSSLSPRGFTSLTASPRALASMPKQLRARVRTGKAALPLGRLAHHDDFGPQRACSCHICWPRDADFDPGARTRAKARWRRQEQTAWGEEMTGM